MNGHPPSNDNNKNVLPQFKEPLERRLGQSSCRGKMHGTIRLKHVWDCAYEIPL